MSGRGNNRDNGMFNWFRKCVPCFNPAKEQDDRSGRSGDDSNTPRTIQRTEESLKRSEDSKGKNIPSSQGEGENVVQGIDENLKRSKDRKGKGIASSQAGGDVVVQGIEEKLKRSKDRKGKGIASSLFPCGKGVVISGDQAEEGAMFWSTKDKRHRHRFGDVSAAVIQGNRNLEDYSQVEPGRTALFVGIYDGHGGHRAALFVSRTLTRRLTEYIRETKTMSADHLRVAFLRTEAEWLQKVDERFERDPHIAGNGTCCLVGVFWRKTLYLANAGDSRAIIARAEEKSTKFVAEQLTRDDNVENSEIRAELLDLHPDEPGFVVQDKEGVFRIKGRIQVSKSIGDVYLKRARFNLNDVEDKYKLNSSVKDDNPALSADPSTYTISIGPQDRFMIFASDGLWDLLSNDTAVKIVQEFPKEGIAERLVTKALTARAEDIGWAYEDILRVRRDEGLRRRLHDDISVVVIFFDHTVDQMTGEIQEVFIKHSIRQGSMTEVESNFTALDELVAAEEEGLDELDAGAGSSGGGGDAGAGSSGGGGDAGAGSSGGGGDAGAGSGGGGGDAVDGSGRGEGDAVAGSSGGEVDVAS